MSTRTIARLALVAALASLSIACHPSPPRAAGPAMPARDTVVISDAPYAAYVGAPVTLGARVWRDGIVVPDAEIEWSAAPRSVARIAPDGTLLPVSQGHVVITARVGAIQSRRFLQVQSSAERRVGYATPSRPLDAPRP
ncbi:MAG TPA: hypothetical protein VF761_09050 [Gemmatimonadaceae bacterium]